MSLDVELNLEKPGFTLDARFSVPSSGVSVLFGPSGCGKSTLLRCLAGLERAGGTVRLNGDTWQDTGQDTEQSCFLPAHRRGVGMVFQNAALFEHRNVAGNLSYAVRRSRIADDAREAVIRTLDLDALLQRDVATLSGGEMQRVALARALLARPRLLLLDEPLAALDEARKRDIIPYLERVSRDSQIPVIYVTHNIDELFTLADHLLVMEQGGVLAHGPLSEVLSRTDLPIARREDAGAVLFARVADQDRRNHLTVLEWASQRLRVPAIADVEPGRELRLRVQARDVSLCLDRPADSSILNILPGRVLDVEHDRHAGQRLVRLGVGTEWLFARISEFSRRRLNLEIGTPVFVQIKSVALVST